MRKDACQARESWSERQAYRLNLIYAQYRIAILTGRPATVEDLAAVSLQIAPEIRAQQVAS